MYVKVFLKLLSLSLLDLEHDKRGARDMCETYTKAHATLKRQGNRRAKKNLMPKELFPVHEQNKQG